MVVSDLLMRQTVEESLRAAGYAPVGAAGITRLRQRLSEHTPVAAVMDLETSGLDLDEALDALREAGTRTVGFCGHTERDLRARGLAAGCARVVTRGEVAARLDRIMRDLLTDSATVQES